MNLVGLTRYLLYFKVFKMNNGNEIIEENNVPMCPIYNAVINNVTSSILTESGVQTILRACKLKNVPLVNAVPGGKKAISKLRRDQEAENGPSRKSFRSRSDPRKSKCLFCKIDITHTEGKPFLMFILITLRKKF